MILFSWFQIDRSTNTNIGIGKSEDPKQTSGGKSTIGWCCLFLFIMNFVHDTNLDIGIGKSEKNETGNEKEQTSGGKSTKVHVAGQNKRPGRACTTRFQLYRTQQEQFEGQLEKHTTIKHVWSLECTVFLYMEVIAGRNYRLAVDKINLVVM